MKKPSKQIAIAATVVATIIFLLMVVAVGASITLVSSVAELSAPWWVTTASILAGAVATIFMVSCTIFMIGECFIEWGKIRKPRTFDEFYDL